jgi:hypothetical protein
MRMHPRRYSVLNRSIARSLTYSLRNYYKRNKYRDSTSTNSTDTTLEDKAAMIWIIFIIALLILIGACSRI